MVTFCRRLLEFRKHTSSGPPLQWRFYKQPTIQLLSTKSIASGSEEGQIGRRKTWKFPKSSTESRVWRQIEPREYGQDYLSAAWPSGIACMCRTFSMKNFWLVTSVCHNFYLKRNSAANASFRSTECISRISVHHRFSIEVKSVP